MKEKARKPITRGALGEEVTEGETEGESLDLLTMAKRTRIQTSIMRTPASVTFPE